jgi:hypothetical protein
MRRGYEPGLWRNREGDVLEIAKMQTSHIKNCIAFLQGNGDLAYKRIEFEAELATRTEPIEIRKHVIEVDEELFLRFVEEELGVKIPKSGAGVYVNGDGNKWRVGNKKITIEFDTQRTLKRAASKRSSSRKISKTKPKASKPRG